MAVVALALGVSAFAALPAAAEEKKDPKDVVLVVEWVQDLNLTPEQEAKIADIRKEYKPKVQEAHKELASVVKEEMEKVEGILTAEQKDKVKEAKEERKEFRAERLAGRLAHLDELDLTDAEVAKLSEIRKEFQPKLAKAMEGLKGILNEDQRKAREDALKEGKNRREVFQSLKLSDEQKEKVEAVGKDLRGLVHDELTQMRDVLNDSQKEKLDEFKDERKERIRDRKAHMVSTLKDLNLTDDQKKQIMEIRKEFRPKVHEAGNKLRATIREEVEAILGVIKG
jgi:Spy/CpxP family protein refolding chaperone